MSTDQHTMDTLRQVVADVLERFAFSFVDDEKPQFHDAEVLLSDLAFAGPFRGKVGLSLSRELATELGVNILGVDPENAPPEIANDAIKELTNIICGDLLFRLYGPQAVFDLCVPELHATSSGAAPKSSTAVVELSVEGHRVTAWLVLDA